MKEAGRQVGKGNPILAARVTVGIATSTLSGDIFDTKNGVSPQATGISVNGIWNNSQDADKVAQDAKTSTGHDTQAVKNGTHFGIGKIKIGDVLQCVSESLGAINTPSLNVAESMRDIVTNHPTGELEATGHSQGGSVLLGGMALLDSSIRERTSVQTFGAQLGASPAAGFKDVYNERASAGIMGDPVPYIDPRNWLNHAAGNITENAQAGGHGWVQNYSTDALDRAEKSENP